jgi:hypothetical protein
VDDLFTFITNSNIQVAFFFFFFDEKKIQVSAGAILENMQVIYSSTSKILFLSNSLVSNFDLSFP